MNKVIENMRGSLIREVYEYARASSVDLGLGQINLSPSDKTIDSVVSSAQNHSNYRYTTAQGALELRELIAQRHNSRNGTKYGSGNVLVAAGASAAISSTYLAMLGEGSNIVVPEIAYPTYEVVPQMLGEGKHEVRKLKLDENFLPEISDLEEKLDGKSILVLNSPNNPTGAVIPPKTLEKIADIAKRTGSLVISDEVYSEVYVGDAPESISRYLPNQTVVVDSLSKCGLIPGLRLGWAIAPDHIIGNIMKSHQFMNSCVSSMSQAAGVGVLQNPEQFAELRSLMEANREKLKVFLDEKGFESNPFGGIYCFVNASRFGDSTEASRKILEGADVVTIPGKAFGDKGDDFVRLSYGVDTKTLEEGIKRLNGFL